MAEARKGTFFWPPSLGCWVLFVLLATASTSPAGVVVQVIPPDFGEIDMHPLGGSVVIAAQNGPAGPLSTYSVVTGGGSGSLTLSSPDSEQVEVLYPNSVTLTSGSDSITLSEMNTYSQTSAVMSGGNVQKTLCIGGELQLRGNEKRGSYTGTMTIIVNFY